MPDELAAVLVVAHEPVVPAHVLVQPDRVQVVAARVPEALDGMARIIGEATDAALLCGRKQVVGEVGPSSACSKASSGVAGYSRFMSPPSVSAFLTHQRFWARLKRMPCA